MIVKGISENAAGVLKSLTVLSPFEFQEAVVATDKSSEQPQTTEEPKRLTIKEIQQELNEHFDAQLDCDGVLGKNTAAAIIEAEKFLGLAADGKPDVTLEQALIQLKGLAKDLTPTPDTPAKDGDFGTPSNPDWKTLWDTCTILPEKTGAVAWCVAKIRKGRSQYEEASKLTGVPWEVIGTLHMMESGCNFNCHAHNGDPLTARTVQVPAGRPKNGNPPFTWIESCADALGYDGATGIKDWNIVNTLKFQEKFNGYGYRHHGIYSPYITSYTNHYKCGKYVKDGEWSETEVSKQCGTMAMLKGLGFGV